MTKTAAGLLLGLLIPLPLAAQPPAAEPQAAQESTEQILANFGSELQAAETEIVSKAISLTTDEATKFWPVFKQFQAEQKAITDGQIAALTKYSQAFSTLTDADATAYVKSLLERDQKIHDLRVKYLAEYSKILPPGKAARIIHLTRKLGFMSQAKLAEEVPLVR